ncbi:hypothetical protein GCM10009804_31690 [Kribbella hippodromi]|uniref:Uncharacterized protein n=1 Tax=Kribbella hippodromi TaxID=434347 RepID=A0ABN2D8Z2_9ACTN
MKPRFSATMRQEMRAPDQLSVQPCSQRMHFLVPREAIPGPGKELVRHRPPVELVVPGKQLLPGTPIRIIQPTYGEHGGQITGRRVW